MRARVRVKNKECDDTVPVSPRIMHAIGNAMDVYCWPAFVRIVVPRDLCDARKIGITRDVDFTADKFNYSAGIAVYY